MSGVKGTQEDAKHLGEIDQHPDAHRATAEDEEQVLRELYGEPDSDGIYGPRGGEPVDEEAS